MRKLLAGTILFFVLTGILRAQNCSINAGISSTICINDTLVLNGARSGLFSNGATSVWTQTSGPSVIINTPKTLISRVNIFVAGIYKFKLSIKCKDGLYTEDSITVTVLPLTIANAGKDTTFCPTQPANLTGNTLQSGEIGIWTIISANNAGVTINTPSNPHASLTLNSNVSGITKLRWTIVNINGCVSYDEVIVTNSGGVSPINAGPDQILTNCFANTTCTNLMANNGGVGYGGQQGVWSFVSGPSIPTIAPLMSPTTRVCNLTEGTYVFRYTVSGPCANGFDDVSVIVPPPTQDITQANANAFSSSTTYCGKVNTLSLIGNTPLYTGETVLWIQTSGPPLTITNPTSPSTTVTGITAFGTYCFNYSIKNSTSKCTSVGIVCYALFDNGTVDGGPDQILPCNVTTTTIPTTVTGIGALNYKIISGPNAYSYPINFRTSNVITGMNYPGTYRVEINYTFGLGCSPVSDFVDITVSHTATGSNAGTDQNFACKASSTQLAGNNPVLTGLGSGRWSQISGPNQSNLVTPVNYICSVSGTIPGTYFYRWTITGGNKCTDNFDDIKVVIPDTTVTKANAGADRIVCPYSQLTLQGNNFRADETVQWTALQSGITFLPNNAVNQPIVTGLAANASHQFVYSITNSCGNISKDTVQISTSLFAGPSLADAGSNQCLSAATSIINLNAVIPTSGIGHWKQLSGFMATISDTSLNNTTVTGVRNGTYQFIWTVSTPGCLNSTIDTVTITVSGNTTTSSAGSDITTCSDIVTLNGNIPVNGTGNWSQISGDGGAIISDITNHNATVSNLITGVYIFRWTITNGACLSNFDDVKLTISSPPSDAIAGLDQTLCGASATSAILGATPPIIGSGQWVQASGPNIAVITNNTLANTTIRNLTNGSYTFRWVVTGGPSCPQSTDDVVINISLPANAGSDQNLCNLNSTTLSGNTGSIGIWSQIAGPTATITQLPAGNPNASVSGLIPSSVYTFRYTIPSVFGCPSTFDDVIVKNGSFTQVPDAGADEAYCNATSLALNGSTLGAGETGVWSVIAGPSGTSFLPASNISNPTLTGLRYGTYVLKWTVSNASCSSSDIKRIDNYASPSAANAGVDQTVCFGRTVLRGNTPQIGIGTWSALSGPVAANISSINNPTTDVTGLNAVGAYYFVWTVSNGSACNPSRDTVKLIVSALSPTVANAGTDKFLCNQSTVLLNGNTPSVGTGVWSEVNSSSSTIVSPNSPSTVISSLSAGSHQFVWEISNTDRSCFSRDTVSIANSVTPNTANAGTDDTFCVFSTALLHANDAVAGTTGTWTLLSGSNTPRLLTPNNAACQLTGVIQGTYKFLWTISSLSCPSSSDEVNITIINNADLSIAGANQNLCANNINLYANTPTGNNKGIWSQFDGPNSISFTSVANPNTVVTNLITGTYRFIWKIYNERCYTTDTVTYIINEQASVTAGDDIAVCNNNSVLLSSAFVSSPDAKGTWSVIYGGGTLSTTAPTTTPNTVTYTPDPDYFGTVVLRLSAEDLCHVVTDDISIQIKEASISLLAVNDNAIIESNTSAIINVLANDTIYHDDTLNFCPNSIITVPAYGTASINGDGNITYTPTINYAGIDSFQYQICTQNILDTSCYKKGADSAWVFITITGGDCIIPNAFSPNGDGVNDVFKILCAKGDVQFYVFNSYGIQLYLSEKYMNDWDGTYNDGLLPDGTYFYSLKFQTQMDQLVNKSGFITLHR